MGGDGRLDRYRLNAEKCLELAQTFNDQERKRIMLRMADAWLTLAEQHLKNSETVLMHETPTRANEPPTPPPVDEPPTPPPIKEPTPVSEPPELPTSCEAPERAS
jgi:hypothetical protein